MTSLQTLKRQLLRPRLLRAARRNQIKQRKVRNADALVVSFPKSGRTWLRVLLGKVLSDKCGKNFTIELEDLAGEGLPCIYMTHDDADEPDKPLNSNKRKYRSKKVLFLVRDPRDVVVSYYFQQTKRGKTPVTMDLPSFIRDPGYGIERIIGFMNIWAWNRQVPRDFMIVKYEDLRRDPVAELRKIVGFLDIQGVTDWQLQEAVSFASFENMQQMERSNAFNNGRLKSRDPNDPSAYKVRRGKVGGYTDYLSEEDVEYLNDRVREGLLHEYGYE